MIVFLLYFKVELILLLMDWMQCEREVKDDVKTVFGLRNRLNNDQLL
jgi:hypothetical protein